MLTPIDRALIGRTADSLREARTALNLLQGNEEPSPSRSVAELGLSQREIRTYSLLGELRRRSLGTEVAMIAGHKMASFESELSDVIAKRIGQENGPELFVPREILTRAMSTASGSKGGFLVGSQPVGYLDVLRARSVVLRMGARQLSDLVGNIDPARATGTVTCSWQAGDGTSISATDQAMGQLSATPKTVIAITDVSEQLLRQTSPTAENFLMADLGGAVATAVDNAAINGKGGAEPLGIKNTTGITTGQDAATATQAKLVAFASTAGTANALRGNPGWIANSAGAGLLMGRQRFTSTDSPLWTGNLLDGQLAGFPAASTEQVASGNLIFGSWDELVVADWGVLALDVSRGGTGRFDKALVGVRAMWMVDIMLRYPSAFICSSNLS